MAMSPIGPVDIWYEALRSHRGVIVTTNNVEYLLTKLYSARRELGDPDLDCFKVVRSPTSRAEVWIIRKGKTDEA